MVRCEKCGQVLPKEEELKDERTKAIEEFDRWSNEEYCLEAVKRDGYALECVKDQTEAICLEAVKETGSALGYVKDQTEAICLEAVKEDGDALGYVRDREVFLKLLDLKLQKKI